METTMINVPWYEVKQNLLNCYSDLTEKDFEYRKGEEHDLVERLLRKTGQTPDELIRFIKNLSHS
ncbi:MAG: hypothetical protein JWO06_742 [Bacteroidota bacterium]|nr:hypothetical protein [Bacteroidota bacterium]